MMRASLLLSLMALSNGCARTVADQIVLPPSQSPRDPAPLADRLGAGDLFEVRVLLEADLSGLFRVGPEGRVDFPFCGPVEVAGRTAPEVAELLRRCLSDGWVRDPQVVVTARESQSKKVVVYGHVQKPGAFVFEDDMTVVQAIAAAGGFTPFAAQDRTIVIRASPQEDKRFEVPVQAIGLGRAPSFYLRPGDVVFVPESWK
jgi:protein involved in polysaccharide export with SLBB domain